MSRWQSPPLQGFFLFERRVYTSTIILLMVVALAFLLIPGQWILSDPAARWVREICSVWPKMAHDSEIIGLVSSSRAGKYVLVNAVSTIVVLISTVTELAVMLRMGVEGPRPYYVNNGDAGSLAVLTLGVIYLSYFDQWMVGLEGHKARSVYGTDVSLFFSAALIGLCGTGIVRTVATFWRRRIG